MLGTLRGDGYAALVVRFSLAFKDTLDGAELTADFLHHLLGGTTHGIHRHAAEHEGHHGTDEDTDEYDGVHQVDIVGFHKVNQSGFGGFHAVRQVLTDTDQGDLDFFNI